MKKLHLSLVASLALACSTTLSAESLKNALTTNAKISGEVAVTYEMRDVSKEVGTYYRNTDYSVGSFALKYETGSWNNFSFTSKVRAYKTLFEGGENEQSHRGWGDASERFWETDGYDTNYNDTTVDFSELFVKYDHSNFTVKAGRQQIYSDWLDKTHDAVKVDAKFGSTSIEAVWTARLGRIDARDYRPMAKINNSSDGAYKFAITQGITENISATVYDLIIPDERDIIGGRVNLEYGDTKIRAHYAANKTDISKEKDSSVIDLRAQTTIAGFTPFIGFIGIDDDYKFDAYSTEEIINCFEEGDAIYEKGAKTYYIGVSKTFGDLSATLLHGDTSYEDGNNSYDLTETTLWLGYNITKDVKANLGYTNVNADDNPAQTDLNQLNVTLTYSF